MRHKVVEITDPHPLIVLELVNDLVLNLVLLFQKRVAHVHLGDYFINGHKVTLLFRDGPVPLQGMPKEDLLSAGVIHVHIEESGH